MRNARNSVFGAARSLWLREFQPEYRNDLTTELTEEAEIKTVVDLFHSIRISLFR
jgi:hypothetical protein